MKTSGFLSLWMLLLVAARSEELEKVTQPGMVSGTVDITFDSRTRLTDDGRPEKGAKDVYEIAINVGKTTEFKGRVERQSLITKKILGTVDQPGQLFYSLDLAVINPVDMTQRKTVGKWVGTVPIDAQGVHELAGTGDSPQRIRVDAIGKVPAFTDDFGGRLYGKGKKTDGVMSYVRRLQGKEVKIQVNNVDPMRFENVTLAMGPAQSYPKCTVNGNLDFDYETGNWLTNGLRFHYTLNGRDYDDVVTGSIKWVEDPDRSTNGKGRYEFNLRWNEDTTQPARTEADAFKIASDEEAFFAMDNSVPSLTGTVTYVDTMAKAAGENSVTASKIIYQLDANQLTKQQVMNFIKLWLIGIGPTNDE
ncbi:hypothetical protein [Prosthecobacter sp.]|uniref:hypothetical protein n=1 Tax=Prosthecobacter sp. TaxID=1965333 RepID=UPI001D4BE010|nr:hypothetical protein [Prosthecobacter sp.]MCB1275613.1 hypothetical protein [Prosthecobacter sp.]